MISSVDDGLANRRRQRARSATSSRGFRTRPTGSKPPGGQSGTRGGRGGSGRRRLGPAKQRSERPPRTGSAGGGCPGSGRDGRFGCRASPSRGPPPPVRPGSYNRRVGTWTDPEQAMVSEPAIVHPARGKRAPVVKRTPPRRSRRRSALRGRASPAVCLTQDSPPGRTPGPPGGTATSGFSSWLWQGRWAGGGTGWFSRCRAGLVGVFRLVLARRCAVAGRRATRPGSRPRVVDGG